MAPTSLQPAIDPAADDHSLTYETLALGAGAGARSASGAKPAPKKTLLIACGAIAREVLAICASNQWTHFDTTCLPAILHNTPGKIPDAVEHIVTTKRAAYDDTFVLYADCGTGGLLQARCDALGVTMLRGPHCYSFFEGNAAFAARDEMTAFYLTDFLVRQFDAFVWKPLGLDCHPDLRDMYFAHYTTLVYQAQTDDPALKTLARGHADRLGLAFEYRFTGYGDLETELRSKSDASPT